MLGHLFILLIKAYQRFLSPLLGQNCRFYPSCSQYAVECFDKYSVPKSFIKIGARLGKCHPWHPGGIDLP
ncbi:membrane protein insertion efficiency factor YidD [Pseudobacteriovorax antillogorgiicola]|uniref:membrane protein insertion efficiency factor YidD n=1 Tax=Pseudobacteriovorax antillogorgiicola TaxID=1513793 RepID=UPI00104A0A7D